MTFAEPIILYALAAVPVAATFVAWTESRRRAAMASLGDAGLVERLALSVNRRGRKLRTWLWLAALTLVIVTAARPQWGSEVQVVEQKGVQVMIALDVSESMLAEDIKPNRLSRAKLEIGDLMSQLGGDEVGLVLFSGAAFVQFPLTFDYSTARTFVDAASPAVISRPGTAIAEAIEISAAAFDETRVSQRVIVLMTDGETKEGDPVAAAARAAADGVVIYAVGFGSPEGEPIPEFNIRGEKAGFKSDRQGEVVLSKLDEVTLQLIAFETRGKYYRAGADGQAMQSLTAELADLQQETTQSEFQTRNVERFQVFLAVALVALLAAELVPDHVLRRPPPVMRGIPG